MSASIWNPSSSIIPQADPNAQIKSEIFTATEGQTTFILTQFTYTLEMGALSVFRNGVKLTAADIVEINSSSFSLSPCTINDTVEAVGNTAIADPTAILAEVIVVRDEIEILAAQAAASAASIALPISIGSGGTGGTSLIQAKLNLELNNVNNTTDLAKPISNLTQEALNLKISKTSDTGSALGPVGTTEQRDSVPVYGAERTNSELNVKEWWNGVIWSALVSDASSFAPKNSPIFAGPVTIPQYINIMQTYGALQIAGIDVLRFGGDTSGQLAGFRNRIINGDMRIDQRYSGVTQSLSNVYTVDRFQYYASQPTKFVFGQNLNSINPPAGFAKYLGFGSASAFAITAGDYFAIGQPIEGFNTYDFGWGTASAKSAVLSFMVYSSLTGTHGGVVKNGASTRSYPFTYTIPVANIWTPIRIVIPGDTTGVWAIDSANGITIMLAMGCGATFTGAPGAWAMANYISATGCVSVVGTSGASFYITGVQFEKSSIATPFENRPIGFELAQCQRYYQTGVVHTIAPSMAFAVWHTCQVNMRAVPTVIPVLASGGSAGYTSYPTTAGWRYMWNGVGSGPTDYALSATSEL